MKAPGILSGIVFALVASIIGSLFYTLLPLALSVMVSLKITLIVLSAAYLVYLIRQSGQRTGRVTIIIAWLSLSISGLIFDLPISYLVLSQVAMIWLVRSIVFHSSILTSLFDLGLIAIGLLAAVWAMLQTGSIAVSFWCFFLLQSLFGFLPDVTSANKERASADQSRHPSSEDRFQSAHRVALDAIQKLTH